MIPLIRLFILFVIVGSVPSSSFAAERVALVIGNGAYQNGSVLANPVNDAQLLANALQAAQFEVTLAQDAGLAEMEKAVINFRRSAEGAKAAWFFYAGHGMEVKGTNFLIPVDAQVTEEFEVKHKTLALDFVLSALDEAGTPLKVVVLDCCRNNPFGRSWSRSGSAGLSQVTNTPSGTIIAFAAAPGNVASDGEGANSPYTTALAQALTLPGKEIDQVFKETGRLVLAATDKEQQPWINSSFYDTFIPCPGEPGSTPPAPSTPIPMVKTVPAKEPTFSASSRGMEGSRAGEMRDFGGIEMVWCPPGEFMMGSPPSEEGRDDDEGQHLVKLTKGFWLAKTETTQGQWESVMWTDVAALQASGAEDNTEGEVHATGPDVAMYFTSWEDAQECLAKLNGNNPLPAGWKWDLPTEAQWEYACRAGTETATYAGALPIMGVNHAPALDPIAWYGGNSSVDYTGDVGFDTSDWKEKQYPGGIAGVREVGLKEANDWGLHDMLGNVWEWSADWLGDYPNRLATNPTGATEGSNRVYRGGSWLNYAANSRAAFRAGGAPDNRYNNVGFRLAAVPEGQ